MSLPRFTISDWSAGKYGSEKSTVFSRSGVIVAADATMSNRPCARLRKIGSNGVFTNFASRSSRFAISFTTSTSKPW